MVNKVLIICNIFSQFVNKFPTSLPGSKHDIMNTHLLQTSSENIETFLQSKKRRSVLDASL